MSHVVGNDFLVVAQLRGKIMLLTSNKKSPFKIPAISATPPGSTSSMYWRPGHFWEGIISISGEAALAPRNTNPNPRLPLCKTAFRCSPGTLKVQELCQFTIVK